MTLLDKLKNTSWQLVSYQSQDENGNIIYPLGKDAEGIIIFTNENWMAVQIMAKNKSNEGIVFNSDIEKQISELGYHAYTGPITIDEQAQVLETQVTYSIINDYVGTKQRRIIEYNGDILNLNNAEHSERFLRWRRIK